MEIIRVPVNDDGTAENVFDGEALVIERHPGVTLIGEEGRQITGMIGMEAARCAEMTSGFHKAVRAIPVLMDVHGVKI